MSMNNKAEKLLDSIEVPYSLSEQQATLAKKLVKARMLDGFSIQSFCGENGISTKTYYAWHDIPDFTYYLNQVSDCIIPADEKDAFQKIKKHILKIADKQSPSIKEIELFTDTFSYVVENDKRERMEALGISDGNNKPNTSKSLEEKRNSLLSRLMASPNSNKGEINNGKEEE
jgi:hypothetical protein